MLSASVLVLSAIYLIFLVGFLVFSAFALYHLEEYGYVGDFSRSMSTIYIATAGVIMLLTIAAFMMLGWGS